MSVRPVVVGIDMGYGHMRAASALARALGTSILEVDRAPLAGLAEQRQWQRMRRSYEWTSRLSQAGGLLSRPLRKTLDSVTFIPHLHPYRDLSAPSAGARALEAWIDRGLGRGLVEHLCTTGEPLVTTFYAPAILADRAGLENVTCVVTDVDINRIWAPVDARSSRIRFLVPAERTARRLQAYGVPAERIERTGFPLPEELLGGRDLAALRKNLAARLVRLDPSGAFRRGARSELAHFIGPLPADQESQPPLVTFAVGGAGAQAELPELFLERFRPLLAAGRIRITLVAGVRAEVATRFDRAITRAGLESFRNQRLEILHEPGLQAYFDRFHALLAKTDVLWTKPSEMTFFAALGLPIVFSWPVGAHERYNRRWAIEGGAGLRQGDPRFAAEWIADWLADGTLAAAAWSGFVRLPKFGLYTITDRLLGRSETDAF